MRRPAVLIVVAALLFGGTAFFAYRAWCESRPDPLPTRKNTTASTTAPVKGAQQVVYYYPVLVRELVRQGLLMAEADAGMVVADRSLQPDGGTGGWDADVVYIPLRRVHVRLLHDGQLVRELELPDTGKRLDYVHLVEAAETLSRNEFAGALRTPKGVPASSAPPTTGPAGLDARIEALLSRMDVPSQFQAVRLAHRWSQYPGGEEKAVGALVRGYANLGQLTQFLWSPAHKVFYARSLLYAQRLLVRQPKSSDAYRYRAYALALAGLQGEALKDLEAAAQLPPSDDGVAPWAELLEPYCRYDTAKLVQLGTEAGGGPAKARAPLAVFLAFLTIESCDSPSAINGYGQGVLSLNPGCVRVVDRMIEASGVAYNHQLTLAGPIVWWQSLFPLTTSEGVPAEVKTAVVAAKAAGPQPEPWARVAEALAGAADEDRTPGAPSWGVLGQIARDTHFVVVQRRAAFMAESWSVPAGEFVAEVWPLVKSHPYRGLLECYAAGGPGPGELAKKLGDVVVTDADVPMTPLFDKMRAAGLRPPPRNRASPFDYYDAMQHNIDRTSGDLEHLLRWRYMPVAFPVGRLRDLQAASPHAPLYMAKLVETDWPKAEPLVAEWVAEWGDHPVLAGALGRKYSELLRWPEAIKSLESYLSKAPDAWAFELLAADYLTMGDEAKWLATLKRALGQPDYGLDHARVNDRIARHYMERANWAAARPYADAAAESGAAWALKTACTVHEGLGEWEAAEALIRAEAERYGRPNDWLDWCLRTGHGDTAAARKAQK